MAQVMLITFVGTHACTKRKKGTDLGLAKHQFQVTPKLADKIFQEAWHAEIVKLLPFIYLTHPLAFKFFSGECLCVINVMCFPDVFFWGQT